tara:strand:- start:6771 stop:6914 length:144 start_codon:yes stop_codon:yes gene_type:complete
VNDGSLDSKSRSPRAIRADVSSIKKLNGSELFNWLLIYFVLEKGKSE